MLDPKRLEGIDTNIIYSRASADPEEFPEYDEKTLICFEALILAQSPVLAWVLQRLLASAISACESKKNELLEKDFGYFFLQNLAVFRIV